MNGIDRILSCFPAKWRARYGAEVRDLLQDQPVTWRVYRDLLFAGVDAWTRLVPAAAWRACVVVWELVVISVVVTSVTGVGWVVATGAHQTAVHLGFAGWIQGLAGPALSETVTDSRGLLWFVMGWCVLGWRRKLKVVAPGPMTIVYVLMAFSMVLALDMTGPRIVDAICFGSLLCHPVTRRPGFVAWMTGRFSSSSRVP